MPANIAVLGEREIREKIIGNTLVSNPGDEGMEVVEYLHPDGSVRSLWMNERAEGFWVVSRSLLCLYYPLRLLDYPPRSASLYHCFTLTLDADRVGFFDQDGRTVDIETRLSPGDARGL